MERPDDTYESDRCDALLVPACVTTPCRVVEDGAARCAADESAGDASQPCPGFQGKDAAATLAGSGIPAQNLASSSSRAALFAGCFVPRVCNVPVCAAPVEPC
jgi:hypothetical protein